MTLFSWRTARPPVSDGRQIGGIVASYVATDARTPAVRDGLGELFDYLELRGLAPPTRPELERTVLDHWSRLEHETDLRRREAALFAGGQPPRPARLRHGAPFCPGCGRFKNHRKECGHCGYLEMTR